MDNFNLPSSERPNDVDYWKSKLIGKGFVDHGDMLTMSSSFTKDDLPSDSRVLSPGMPTTRDHQKDRLNVVLDNTNTVSSVYYG